MCVKIPEDAVIDPKFGSWTSSFLTQRRRGAEKTARFEFFESYLLLCNPTLSTPRWVKIHSVRKILVFSIFPITSLFLCVTLRLAAPCSPSGSRRSGNPTTSSRAHLASALKSIAVFRLIPRKRREVYGEDSQDTSFRCDR